MLHAYDNKVIVHNMERGYQQTQDGILLGNDEGKTAGLRDRWAQVYAIGKGVTEINVGEWILIRHGRWTRGIDYDDTHLYMVDWPSSVIMSSNSIDEPAYKTISTHKLAKEYEYKPEEFTEFTGNKLNL